MKIRRLAPRWGLQLFVYDPKHQNARDLVASVFISLTELWLELQLGRSIPSMIRSNALSAGTPSSTSLNT